MIAQSKQFKRIIVRGKAVVFIDWANVYGWEKTLKTEISPKTIFSYLSEYQEINSIRLYFGQDIHIKSGQFLEKVKEIGYEVITKPVKYILAGEVSKQKIFIRKCDFDMEVCIDVHRLLEDGFESFIFLTGDGDYAPLYQTLIGLGKQVVVIYASGHLGREIWNIKKGLFKAQLKNLVDI